MKILERLALILFSIIMIVIAITSCLIIFNFIELGSVYNFIEGLIQDDTAKKVIVGISIVSILLAVKALFFPTKVKKRQELKTGVLLEDKDGRLLISKDTIENLVNSVVKSFDEAIDVQTKVTLDSSNEITVFISLLVREDSIIKELSANIQNRIKDTIKRSTGLEVNQVNINVKDIDNDKKGNSQTKIKANDVKIEKKVIQENQKFEDEKKGKVIIEQTEENNDVELNQRAYNNEPEIGQVVQEFEVLDANQSVQEEQSGVIR